MCPCCELSDLDDHCCIFCLCLPVSSILSQLVLVVIYFFIGLLDFQRHWCLVCQRGYLVIGEVKPVCIHEWDSSFILGQPTMGVTIHTTTDQVAKWKAPRAVCVLSETSPLGFSSESGD